MTQFQTVNNAQDTKELINNKTVGEYVELVLNAFNEQVIEVNGDSFRFSQVDCEYKAVLTDLKIKGFFGETSGAIKLGVKIASRGNGSNITIGFVGHTTAVINYRYKRDNGELVSRRGLVLQFI